MFPRGERDRRVDHLLIVRGDAVITPLSSRIFISRTKFASTSSLDWNAMLRRLFVRALCTDGCESAPRATSPRRSRSVSGMPGSLPRRCRRVRAAVQFVHEIERPLRVRRSFHIDAHKPGGSIDAALATSPLTDPEPAPHPYQAPCASASG